MADRRHLAERIDGEIVGLALLAGLHVEDVEIVRRPQFFQQILGYTLDGCQSSDRYEHRSLDLTVGGCETPFACRTTCRLYLEIDHWLEL